jgi:hypothetical protein
MYFLKTNKQLIGSYDKIFDARNVGKNYLEQNLINNYYIEDVDGLIIWTDADDYTYN